MIGHHAQCREGLEILAWVHAGQPTALANEVEEQVTIVVVDVALLDTCDAFEAHAGVDARSGEVLLRPVCEPLVLP